MADGRTYPPTDEQQAAVDLFATGDPLAVEAGAGTGKTTTLAMMARGTPRIGTYLAFNRDLIPDARRAMPMTVDSRTLNSAAFRAVVQQYPQGRALLDRLNMPRVAPYKAAQYLGLGALLITIPLPGGGSRRKMLQPSWQAGHVMRAISNFCDSADPEPAAKHFPYVEGIDTPDPGGRRTYGNNDAVAKELEPALHRAWADLIVPTGRLRFMHSVYVKLAQLHRYPIARGFVLFDEAQDANGVMLALLADHDGQVVYVGDSQQQIYAWRGAVNALGRLDGEVPRAWLTQSWRFGSAVADVANVVLDQLGAELRLTGNPGIDSRVCLARAEVRPRAVLCRTNAVAVQHVLNFQERGMAPHLIGGADDIVWFAQAAAQLQAGERTSHPELACFDTWTEVKDYVENDPQGGDLRMLVSLMSDYGPDIVIEALTGLLTQEEADVIISTAHRAKGREWASVRIAGDFEPGEDADLAPEEWRLLYVAATRAARVLDLSGCAPLRELML